MNKIELFWDRFLEEKGLSKRTKYVESFYFDLEEESANKLLEMVLIGKKKATTSSLESWKINNLGSPKVGDYSIVTDWNGTPRCVIQTKNIIIIPFREMTYEICQREGEDECLETWRQNHVNFFAEEGNEMGYEFTEDMMIVFEDFKVIYQK